MILKYPKIRYENVGAMFDLSIQLHVHVPASNITETLLIAAKVIFKLAEYHLFFLNYIVVLYRFKDAWTFAAALDTVDSWTLLAETAVQHLDVELGMYVFII